MSIPPSQHPNDHHRPNVWLLLIPLLLTLAACTSPTPAPAAVTPQETAVPTATPVPTATLVPTATPIPLPPPSADVAALPGIFADSLGITLQPNSGGWEGVEVLTLAPQLWPTFTTGFRPFDPIKNHAIPIFIPEDCPWVELGRF